MKKDTVAIILAAGKGERMKSALPKVLHEICARPMILYVRDLVKSLKIKKSVAVVGFKHDLVSPLIEDSAKIVIQKKLLGSGDAVKAALTALKGFHGTVLILYGDCPLLKKESVSKLIAHHNENRCDATLLTAVVEKPAGYGRILRDKFASICGIIEEKDADDFQKGIKEINTGIICFNKDALAKALGSVKADNLKKEYYLTDVIGVLYEKGGVVDSVRLEDPGEALGINSRVELARANAIMQKRINDGLMKEGVTIIDPASAFIGYGAKIGRDTTVYPFVVIERDVAIGKNCSVGPFVHLRDGTRISDSVYVGNFIEIVRSAVSSHTLVKHFGYIGDTAIGQAVNIGAGFVTANFDGARKSNTVIKDNAFIGSDTILVAPVTIGKGAKTGAGSVVVKNQNVPDGEVVAGVPARLLRLKQAGRT